MGFTLIFIMREVLRAAQFASRVCHASAQPDAGSSVVLQLDAFAFERFFKRLDRGCMTREAVVALRFKIAKRVYRNTRRLGEFRLLQSQ